MAAATLTATSVGITARVLSDLGHLGTQEGQIILGAALIDDVLGLLLLTIIEGLSQGQEVFDGDDPRGGRTGLRLPPRRSRGGDRWAARCYPGSRQRIETPSTLTVMAVVLALAMAWLADRCGSAMIIGAFAAGLILSRLPRGPRDRAGDHGDSGHVFVPIFFVSVGAVGADRCAESARSREPPGLESPAAS